MYNEVRDKDQNSTCKATINIKGNYEFYKKAVDAAESLNVSLDQFVELAIRDKIENKNSVKE
jgi:predicted HicB family RNase H-like nuclease